MPPSFRGISTVLSHAPTRSFVASAAGGNLAPWGTGDGVLEGWYDISDAATLTFSAAGARVATVADKSGKGRNWTRSGAADPIYLQPAQNGLNGMKVNDADACTMASSTFTAVSAPIMYMCAFVADSTARGEPRLHVNNIIAWWRHVGLSPAGTAAINAGSTLSANFATSAGTAYWLQAIMTGDAATFVRLSAGTKQIGSAGAGGASLTQTNFGPNSAVAEERVNATLLECFWISNPSAADEANAKTYMGNKWAMPTS